MVLDKTAWILIPHLIPFITFVEYSHYSHYADISHQGSENQSLEDSMTPWIVAHQAYLSMEFSRQEYWSKLPFPTPGDLPKPGIKARFPTFFTV